jgi:hypothetical protein
MGEGSIPFQGGDSLLRKTDPLDLENPLPFNQKSIDEGKKHFGRGSELLSFAQKPQKSASTGKVRRISFFRH